MKYFILSIVLLSCNFVNSQITFNYTGAVQTYTVPLGVFEITVDMVGASGGTSIGLAVVNNPGLGGRVETTLSVTPGDVLSLYVGGQGLDGSPALIVPGGWNGGGDSGTAFGLYGGGCGGGASDIRLNGVTLADRVVVAGAGGGSATNTFAGGDHGGDGGGLIADNGVSGDLLPTVFGYGGTQVAGGAFGFFAPYINGVAGVLGIGGNAGSNSAGGAGGGGYYGGGGGCWGGGGGGSDFVNGAITAATTHTPGFNTGNGQITITPHSVLPVEVGEITATLIDDYIEISWITHSELNNDYFTLEKSTNGINNWQRIDVVDGAGNSSEKLHYAIIDKAPSFGPNYYRLMQTDYNGVREYFNPVYINYSKQLNGFVYPNPVKSNLTLTLDKKVSQNDISIFNLMGQDVTNEIQIHAISENEFGMDLSNLPLGSYIIRVGSQSYKIIKVV